MTNYSVSGPQVKACSLRWVIIVGGLLLHLCRQLALHHRAIMARYPCRRFTWPGGFPEGKLSWLI